jgi:glycosyltransferase involved in cell wall biosynthesis
MRRRNSVGRILATGEDVGFRIAALFKLLRIRTPVFIICHNISTRWPSLYLRRLRIDSSVTRFLCMSRSQERLLQDRCNGRARTDVIGWQVDHDFFQPVASSDLPLIVSAGMARRDYATLIEATRELGVDVKIAADSPWFTSELNIDVASLPPNVDVRSYGTYANLRDLYGAATVVVVPLQDVEYAAGYSVILEAMAMGKPVIATRTRQPDDFIEDGVTGLYVAPYDPIDLRAAIEKVLASRAEAEQMGVAGRHRVERYFTLDAFVEHVALACTT